MTRYKRVGMIRELKIRNFKLFAEQSFFLEGHVVLAGPNNMGKTTVLQAIAAWNLALNRWKQLNNFQRRGGAYALLPPDGRGADIVAEYRPVAGGPSYDICSAGSGFQQVLMLLTFLHTRP